MRWNAISLNDKHHGKYATVPHHYCYCLCWLEKTGSTATVPHHYCYCLCWLEIRDPRRNKHQTEALLFCNEDSLAERWDRWPRTGPRRTFTVVAVEEEDIDMMMDDVKCEGAAVLIKLFFK